MSLIRCLPAGLFVLMLIPTLHGQDLRLPTDSRQTAKLLAATDAVAAQDWDKACQLLQSLLDLKEDVIVEVVRSGKDDKGKRVLVGVRGAASRILGERPPELLEAYQKQFGPTARELLTQAQKDKD